MACGLLAYADTQSKKEPKAQRGDSSLTGCVDEQSGRYILVDDRQLKPIADLEAEGFPVENFARYLGHKVIVRGTSIPGDTPPRMKVRNIQTVSESCTPLQQQ